MRSKTGHSWETWSSQPLHRRWGNWGCHLMGNCCAKRSFDLPPCWFRTWKQAKTVRTSLVADVWLLGPAGLLLQAIQLLQHGDMVCRCCVQWLWKLEKGSQWGERAGGTGERVGKGRRREVGETELTQIRGWRKIILEGREWKKTQDLEGEEENESGE